MKSFYKNAFIVAVICIIVGIGMIMVGTAKGGVELFRYMVENGEFNFSPQDLENWSNDFVIDSENLKENEDAEISEYKFDTTEYKIENLDLSVGASLLRIEYDDTDSFLVKIEKSKIGESSCEVEGNTLHLTSNVDGVENLIGDSKAQKIVLTIPKDYMFKEIKLSLGVGSVQGKYLYADNIYVDIGAGNITLEKLKAEEKSEISVGAGNFETEEMEAAVTDIRCEAGRIYIEDAAIKNDITLSCEAGYIYMDIQGKEKSYNYDLDCSVGSITVGKQTHRGVNFYKKTNHHADRTLKAECNVGAIEIEFD